MDGDSPSTGPWAFTPTDFAGGVLDDFRAAWREGRQPVLEEYLAAAGGVTPDDSLLRELLALEVNLRRQEGEEPTAGEYERRFPDHLAAVRSVFAAPTGAVPDQIGRYRVCRRLGGGGFGHVYLCHDDQTDRAVAVKVPRADRFSSDDGRKAFLREARNVAQLDHSGIVPLYDVGEADGRCFLVYKFIEGMSLKDRLRQGPVSEAEAVRIVAEVARALHHAHGKNLFHRDIKPGNILLDRAGRAFVTDFGSAVREEDLPTERGYRSGTRPFMSPEQVRGEGHRVDGRTDVYSLGVVFYLLLCGRLPFTGDSAGLFDQILHQEIRPPRQFRDSITPELERICLKAMARSMSARYPTARDLAEDLAQAGPMSPGSSVPTSSFPIPGSADHASPTTPASGERAGRVVPKGLRPFGPEDGGSFLELLPGPRDRDGLPESVAFWKAGVDSRDPERAFAVGLLYGPSGCGKSSLVRAGLLPRLDRTVAVVYVECSPGETERKLARGLCRVCPTMHPEAPLLTLAAEVRRAGGLPDGSKVFLVLDQFEQWLHAHGHDLESAELVAALRHADGTGLQALLLVRDEFWMGVSRLFEALEVRLDRERNARAVELFDARHAGRVLRRFGEAYERFAEGATEDHEAFLARAVAQLSEDRHVIPVRLSLFADLMKDRPWTPAGLDEVGGTEGVGLRFLEETFHGRSALPDLRALERPGRALLQALLPESYTDLKGPLRSRDELAAACGLASGSARFARLLEILDRELHLITPAESEQVAGGGRRVAGQEADPSSPATPYQLTHDFLVPPLRDWLTQERRRTWRGRAELTLQERAAQWNRSPGKRFLPSPLEFAAIALGVPAARRKPGQRAVMRAATRHYAARAVLALAVLVAFGWAGLVLHRRTREAQADHLAARLLEAETAEVPALVDSLAEYQDRVKPRLEAVARDPEADPKRRLHASLALLPVDPAQADFLAGRLLNAEPGELAVIRDALGPYRDRVSPRLWEKALDSQAEPRTRFRAAVALAGFAPDDRQWDQVRETFARHLVSEYPVQASRWVPLLWPVHGLLTPPLRAAFADPANPEHRYVASLVLAEFLADQPEALADLIREADDRQLPVLTDKVAVNPRDVAGLLGRTVAERLSAQPSEEAKEALAKRQTNCGLALLLLGRPDDVWPLLKRYPDPRVRSYLIHRIGRVRVDAKLLTRQLDQEADASIRAALLLSLGGYDLDLLRPCLTPAVLAGLQDLYRRHPDPGVHSATDWLLRRLGHGAGLAAVDHELASPQPRDGRRWFVNNQGQTFAVIPGPAEFTMGSPPGERGRLPDEQDPHPARIPYAFALSTREVTVEEFGRFRPEHQADKGFSPESRCPINLVTLEDASRYCNWLSEREGLPETEHCYAPSGPDRDWLPKKDYLAKRGYRLPTEAEWEYAALSGAATNRHYGPSAALLWEYAWFFDNAESRTWPVGLLKPNDFGLFDVLGNVAEWAEDRVVSPSGEGRFRAVLRGGSFLERAPHVRPAARHETLSTRYGYAGFRVARTCD